MTPNLPLLTLSNAQIAVEAMATIAFALSGLIEAARRKLDAVGVCVVAGLAAFGGGTLRDVLLDRRPFFWVEHANWLWGLLALCVVAMLFLRRRHLAPMRLAGGSGPLGADWSKALPISHGRPVFFIWPCRSRRVMSRPTP